MKVRVLFALLAVLATPLIPRTVVAQRNNPNTPRLLVTPFQSTDKQLRIQAPEALRNRLAHDVNQRDLYVIPKNDIEFTLQASGYPIDEPLVPNDARALAIQLKANEYVEGKVARSLSGVRMDASLLYAQNKEMSVAQPLPAAQGKDIKAAAQLLSRSIVDARKQIAGYKKCLQNRRQDNPREAVTAGWTGVTAYPNATIARSCIGDAYYDFKAKDSVTFKQYRMDDSVLALANEIRKIDPRNIAALRWAADIYRSRGDEDKEVEALLALFAADPTNLTLQKQVANDLAARGKAALAVPVLREALNNSPADAGLMKTAWLVYLAAEEWEEAVNVGIELVKIDTTAADTTYYTRLAVAYVNSGKVPQALETYVAGTTKYPGNGTLWILYGDALRKNNQIPEAIVAVRHGLEVDPKVENAYVLLAQMFATQNQSDSVMAVLKLGATSPAANKEALSTTAQVMGANASKSAAANNNKDDYQRAIEFFEMADQLAPTSSTKFFIGRTAFAMGDMVVRQANEAKSCELSKLARDSFNKAQIYLPQAARDVKLRDNAMTLLKFIPQYDKPVATMIKGYCK